MTITEMIKYLKEIIAEDEFEDVIEDEFEDDFEDALDELQKLFI